MDTETNSVVTVGFATKVDHQTTSKISTWSTTNVFQRYDGWLIHCPTVRESVHAWTSHATIFTVSTAQDARVFEKLVTMFTVSTAQDARVFEKLVTMFTVSIVQDVQVLSKVRSRIAMASRCWRRFLVQGHWSTSVFFNTLSLTARVSPVDHQVIISGVSCGPSGQHFRCAPCGPSGHRFSCVPCGPSGHHFRCAPCGPSGHHFRCAPCGPSHLKWWPDGPQGTQLKRWPDGPQGAHLKWWPDGPQGAHLKWWPDGLQGAHLKWWPDGPQGAHLKWWPDGPQGAQLTWWPDGPQGALKWWPDGQQGAGHHFCKFQSSSNSTAHQTRLAMAYVPTSWRISAPSKLPIVGSSRPALFFFNRSLLLHWQAATFHLHKTTRCWDKLNLKSPACG